MIVERQLADGARIRLLARPVIAGGILYINSGYGALGGRPGNVLLAFGIE